MTKLIQLTVLLLTICLYSCDKCNDSGTVCDARNTILDNQWQIASYTVEGVNRIEKLELYYSDVRSRILDFHTSPDAPLEYGGHGVKIYLQHKKEENLRSSCSTGRWGLDEEANKLFLQMNMKSQSGTCSDGPDEPYRTNWNILLLNDDHMHLQFEKKLLKLTSRH